MSNIEIKRGKPFEIFYLKDEYMANTNASAEQCSMHI